MTVYYLETSALVKRYRTERSSGVIGELLSEKSDEKIFVTSHFTILEIEAVAARAIRARSLSRRAHGVMVRLFAEDLGQHISTLPLSSALVSDAAEATRRHAPRVGDAIHLAAALWVKNLVSSEMAFVTSDVELREAGEAAGFSILRPTGAGCTPSSGYPQTLTGQ